MVQLLVGKQEFATSDASDGLALAICHAHTAKTIGGQKGSHGSAYANALKQASGKRSRKGGSLAESLGITAEQVAPGQRRLNLSKE